MPARDSWIDLLRILSAIAVVLFHFNVLPPSPSAGSLGETWQKFWQHGHLGVPVFFALSGFCLVPGWLRAEPPATAYTLHRLRRLLPPYWCSLALVLVLAACFKLVTGVNDIAVLPRDPWSIVATLALLTDPLTAVPRLNWVYWTLTPLLGYSLLLGLLRLPPARHRLAVLTGLHVLLCTADLLLQPPGSGWLLFLKYWPMFGLGIAFAVHAAHPATGRLLLATSGLHVLGSTLTGHDDLHYAQAALLTVLLLAATRGRALSARLQPVARLGQLTYSLYLVHVPVGVHLLYRLLPAEPPGFLQLAGSQLLLLAACLAASVGFHRYCERPWARFA